MKGGQHEIRYDYLHDVSVVIAPGRTQRPHEYQQSFVPQHAKKRCVFCPPNLPTDEIIETVGENPWRLAAVKNIFPAVAKNQPKAYGHQEIIIETPDPERQFHDFTPAQIAELFKFFAHRSDQLFADPKINYCLTFKNAGPQAGATIHHSHSQIFATSQTPLALEERHKRMKEYKHKYHSSYYEEMLENEARSKRVIYQDDNLIAFCPYASRYAYEAWLFPRHDHRRLNELSDLELKTWAAVLKKLSKKIIRLGHSYNFALHETREDFDEPLHLTFVPRLGTWGGVEAASDFIINSMPPEDAASYYRK
ncbi:DUF4931 domain-containing protein [Patescibacteria group bacterium]|nr:DUF4931 domain-containing protein [Patescibacteria group bacterium]MBU1705219.1 DUF4931 domain-containing protein [Patescibacteria group bacterium]